MKHHYYTKLFEGPLASSNDCSECIKDLLICFCKELLNATQISGFYDFCNNLLFKLEHESLRDAAKLIQTYLRSRRDSMQPEEDMETSLTEILYFHIDTYV